MKILSLFDGMSVARQALENSKHTVERYYASEIDPYAIAVSESNWKDIIHIGDVRMVAHKDAPIHYKLNDIDLIIGGSPCQDLSIAKKNRKGLDGERSGLFWEYVRILREVKPKYFILENVASMPKEAKEIITRELGVGPIMINASLVSAQNRKRLFWTNIPNVTLPEDRGIFLKDILESEVDEKYYLKPETKVKWIEKGLSKDGKAKSMTATMHKGIGNDGTTLVRTATIGNGGQGDRIYSPDGKSVGLSALGGGRGAKTGLYAVALTETRTEEAKKLRKEYKQKTGEDFSPRRMKELIPRNDEKANTITTGTTKESLILTNTIIRKLTPTECLRLQSMPDNYFDKAIYKGKPISNMQRYKMCGNAFNCKVIEHILSFIPK